MVCVRARVYTRACLQSLHTHRTASLSGPTVRVIQPGTVRVVGSGANKMQMSLNMYEVVSKSGRERTRPAWT